MRNKVIFRDEVFYYEIHKDYVGRQLSIYAQLPRRFLRGIFGEYKIKYIKTFRMIENKNHPDQTFIEQVLIKIYDDVHPKKDVLCIQCSPEIQSLYSPLSKK